MGLTVAIVALNTGFVRTLDLAFSEVDRSDVTVTFTQPVSADTLFTLARIDGVTRVEQVRHVPVILRHGRETHRGALTGLPARPDLYRALDAEAAPIALPQNGIVLSRTLARILGVVPGDTLTVEVREGRRPVLDLPVAAIADTLMGTPAYMTIDALNGVLSEPLRVSGAYLSVDAAHRDAAYARLREMPVVAGVTSKADARAAALHLMETGAGATRYVMSAIAFTVTFGIVYNAARIALAERARDLAGLRVLGFTRAETAFVLLGELAVVTLVALPLGAAIGYGLSHAVAAGFSTELYQIPAGVSPDAYGQATLVVLGAAVLSGLLVKRDLDRIDLIAALKTRE
jgi:putative ABC transport system permease protein